MKKLLGIVFYVFIFSTGFSQIDTISTNIYQKEGRLGIGTTDPGLRLHVSDSNTKILMGHQIDYDGPYINIYSSRSGVAPMLGLGVAKKEYYKSDDTLTMVDWSYIYGNNLNSGIAILPDLQFANYGIYINREGHVGINTKKPKSNLDVAGGIRLGYTENGHAGMLRWTGSDFEGYNGNNWIRLSDTLRSLWSHNGVGLYFDTGHVSIGSIPNQHLLNLQANIGSGIERNLLRINNLSNGASSYTGIILKTGENNHQSVIQDYGINYTASTHYDFGGFLNLSNNSRGLMLHANSPDGIIKFYTGHDDIAGAGIERMRIGSEGYIGIGIKEPVAKLQVADGDIYISDIEQGIIMKSPDGNCWRGVLDNAGQLIFTSIECPDKEISSELQQLKSSESILIFPNPANKSIVVSIGDKQIEKPRYTIYNLSGQVEANGWITSAVQTIDITMLKSGIYFLNIYDKSGSSMASEKIIRE